MRRKRRTAAEDSTVQLYSPYKGVLVPDFLQRPPLRLNEVVFICDVRMLHISPKTNNIRELLPHAFVFPDRFTAFLDEWLHAILLNLLLAIKAKSLFYLKFRRQTMCIPVGLAPELLHMD